LPVDAGDDLCRVEQVVVVEIEKLGWVGYHRLTGQQAKHCFLAEDGAIGGAVGREVMPQLSVAHRIVVLERGAIADDERPVHAERPGQRAKDRAGGGQVEHTRGLHQVEQRNDDCQKRADRELRLGLSSRRRIETIVDFELRQAAQGQTGGEASGGDGGGKVAEPRAPLAAQRTAPQREEEPQRVDRKAIPEQFIDQVSRCQQDHHWPPVATFSSQKMVPATTASATPATMAFLMSRKKT